MQFLLLGTNHIGIPGCLGDHLFQPPICGLNLPHRTQAPLPLLLCPHTPMPGNVLKVCSFCDQFCLWKMSSLSWTQISQILPQSVRLLVLGRTEGLQIFRGCESGHASRLFSVPGPTVSGASTQTAHETNNMICTELSATAISCCISTNAAWMADTSPLHSYVHFFFKHMHDHLWIVVNSCIQPLLISIKPFVRSLHYHYIVSPHQRNCICNLVRGGDELDTVQNKKPVLSYPWLRPEPEISLSQRCRQTTVCFVLQ